MCWWIEDNARLIKENKKLKEDNKKMKEELSVRNEDSLILDIVNAFLVKNNLINDFDKFLHSSSLDAVHRTEDKIRKIWEEL